MNTITQISTASFYGARQTAAKTAANKTKYIYKGFKPEPLYKQTPKMQELVNNIYKYFEEQGEKAQKAVEKLQAQFPNFFIQIDKNNMVSKGKHTELKACREALYTKNRNHFTKIKDIDTYNITGKDVNGIPNFRCTITTPESGLNSYVVPTIFNKTKTDNQPRRITEKEVENCLKDILYNLK